MTVALGNEKATVKGGIYTMLRLPTLDSCSCGEGRWIDGQTGRDISPVCASCHAMCSSGIVSTSTPTLYINAELPPTKAKGESCIATGRKQGGGETTVYTELPKRARE